MGVTGPALAGGGSQALQHNMIVAGIPASTSQQQQPPMLAHKWAVIWMLKQAGHEHCTALLVSSRRQHNNSNLRVQLSTTVGHQQQAGGGVTSPGVYASRCRRAAN